MDSPHKGQWHGALVYSLICAWTNGWANIQDICELRRHRAHYDVTVMEICKNINRSTTVKLTRWVIKNMFGNKKNLVSNSARSNPVNCVISLGRFNRHFINITKNITEAYLGHARKIFSNTGSVIANTDPVITNTDLVITNMDPVIANTDLVITNTDPVITNTDPVIA